MTNERHPKMEQLTDYIHGELSDADDAAVHAHLATCSPCAQAHEEELRLSDLLRAHARLDERDFPLGLQSRIMAAAAAQHDSGWQARLQTLLRPAYALPAAAAAAIAIYFGVTHGAAVQSTTIDAAYYLEDHAALGTAMPFHEGDALPVTLTSDDTATDERVVDASN